MKTETIREAAAREVREEIFRAAVEKEKERIRAHSGKSLWQRLIQKLPFTIRIERNRR